MKRKIFAILFLFFWLKPVILFSAEGISPEDLDSLRDPFTPQLPLPPVEEIQKPAVPNPPHVESLPVKNVVMPPSQSPKFTPPVSGELKPPEIKISGIIWNTDQPQALINNQMVKVGDQIAEWTIEKIDENGIELSSRGKKILIPTNFSVGNSSKKESANPKK